MSEIENETELFDIIISDTNETTPKPIHKNNLDEKKEKKHTSKQSLKRVLTDENGIDSQMNFSFDDSGYSRELNKSFSNPYLQEYELSKANEGILFSIWFLLK